MLQVLTTKRETVLFDTLNNIHPLTAIMRLTIALKEGLIVGMDLRLLNLLFS